MRDWDWLTASHWSRQQIRSELAGQKFDLTFLFNALPYLEDWRTFLASSANLTSNKLIVSVANRYSYGVLTRMAIKRLNGNTDMELIDHPSSHPQTLKTELSQLGLVESEEFLDAPWWPDFCGKPGDSVVSWMLGQIPIAKQIAERLSAKSNPNPIVFNDNSFPYFLENDPRLASLKKKLARHPSFENVRTVPLKRFFAHHRIFVVQRNSVA